MSGHELVVWSTPFQLPLELKQPDRTLDLGQLHREISIFKAACLLRCIRDMGISREGPGLVLHVYAAGARESVRRLKYEGIRAEYLGAETSSTVRENRLAAFASGDLDWLVTTLGLPTSPFLPRVGIVIVAELPLTPECSAKVVESVRQISNKHAARSVMMVIQNPCDEHMHLAASNEDEHLDR